MRKAFCLMTPLVVASYLYALWSDWFTQADLAWVGKRPLFSDPVDLGRAGAVVWDVPKEKWSVTDGEADLSLSLNLGTLREVPESRGQVELRVKVRAEGRTPGGAWENRLVRDRYFTTDQPFSAAGSSLWTTWGRGSLEYGLARVRVVPEEDLRITLDVQVPDGELMTGRPRLKLIGRHDPAARVPHMLSLFLLREGGLCLSIVLVVTLAVMACRRPGSRPPTGENR